MPCDASSIGVLNAKTLFNIDNNIIVLKSEPSSASKPSPRISPNTSLVTRVFSIVAGDVNSSWFNRGSLTNNIALGPNQPNHVDPYFFISPEISVKNSANIKELRLEK